MDEKTVRTRYMRAVVIAAGGVTPTAYHAGVSPQAVYGWLKSGHVTQACPALRLAAKAKRKGWEVWGEPVTAERLAGLVDPTHPPPPEDDPRETDQARPVKRRRRRLRLVGPEGAAVARAELDANPPQALGRIRSKRDNWPLFVPLLAA